MIIIDAGHGGVWPNGDPGAVWDGKVESHYAFLYANALSAYLESFGMETKLTRTQDEYKTPFKERTSGAKPGDLFISIHFDTVYGQRLVYYAGENDTYDSIGLATRLASSLKCKVVSSTESRFGRLYIDDAKCQSVLVEVAPINEASSKEEDVTAFCKKVYEALKPKVSTPFKRVFLVDKDNVSKELPVERMSIVGDKLYIAPQKDVVFSETTN